MNGNKTALLILFGGVSSEHEISCLSAASVLNNINREKYDIYTIGITKDGRWMLTEASPQKIAKGAWEKKAGNKEAVICPDRAVHGIRLHKGKEIHIDCVFPVLHGKNGEDGTMQGLLEIAGLPYVGSGTLASSCAMNKAVTKALVDKTGVRQAKCFVTNRYDFSSDPTGQLAAIEKAFAGEYPLFVKPANAGSSVGVTKVNGQMELFEGIKIAAEQDHKILIEETITGREMEVAVLGNRRPKASPIGEILAADDFYSYEAKYENEASKTEVVTDITEEKEAEMRDAAVTVYEAVGCRGFARVDFFLSDDNEVVFNEINTIPGFTDISMYPQLWEAADVGFSELIDRLIELAMEEI